MPPPESEPQPNELNKLSNQESDSEFNIPPSSQALPLTEEQEREMGGFLELAIEAQERGDKEEANQALLNYQKLLDQYEREIEAEITKLLPEGLDIEVVDRSQELLNYIGLDISLRRQLIEGKIDIPSQEQVESTENLDLTKALIIPAGVSQKQIIEAIKSKYEGMDTEVFVSDTAQTILDEPQTKQRHQEVIEKGYFLFTNPAQEVSQAHPETMNKTPNQIVEQIKDLNQENPNTNFRGLNLAEYLLLQAQMSQQTDNKEHLDKDSYCWLLEEFNDDRSRCLLGYWYERLKVYSNASDYRNSFTGARLAVQPRQRRGGTSAETR